MLIGVEVRAGISFRQDRIMETADTARKPVIVAPDQGRAYPMGRMRAIFKADGAESADAFSVSEWWLEPLTRGPPVHQHSEDHVFYVIAGTLSLCIGEVWSEAPQGSYALIPGGTPHTFENRGSARAGFISFNTPGGFEERMDGIAAALSSEDLRL
jgi:quercetin dioxygenase-like cupin family protein